MIVVVIIIYVLVFCIYFAAPLPLRVLILIVNCLAPDPIPIVDEVIMISGVLSKMMLAENILEFIKEHKIITALIICAAIAIVIYGIWYVL